MSEITVKAILEWMGTATKDELEQITDEVIDRDLAVASEDYAELNSQLQGALQDEMEEGLLQDAADRLRRREYGEALHVLTKALGRDFDALETIPLATA